LCFTSIFAATQSADVTLSCTFETISSHPFSGTNTNAISLTSNYACTLNENLDSLDNVIEIEGTHENTLSSADVKIFVKSATKKMPILPTNLENYFTGLEGIFIDGIDFIILRNEDLNPFQDTLKYLSVINSGLNFLPKGLMADITLLHVVDFSGSALSFIDASAFIVNANFKVLRLTSLSACTDLQGLYEDSELDTFITNLVTSSSICLSDAALQTSLISTLTTTIIKSSEIKKLELNNERCQADLNDCRNAPAPSTSTTIETTTTAASTTTDASTTTTTTQETTIKPTTTSLESTTTNAPTTTTQDKTTAEPTTTTTTAIVSTTTTESTCPIDLEKAREQIDKLQETTEICEDNKSKLEDKVDDLEDEIEKLTPVNGTCRFKETDHGYACSANKIVIKSTSDRSISWKGIHVSGKVNGDVKVLLIKAQETQFLPLNVEKEFTNLEVFIVESSKVSKLRKSDFVGYKKLAKIVVTGNEISSIEGATFDSVDSTLKHLDLSNNKIASLPSLAFGKLKLLEVLNLSKNKLTQLSFDLIPSTNALKNFHADNNNLKNIDIIFVWYLKNAEIIDFSGNSNCNKKFDKSTTDFMNFFSIVLSEC
jgi:Leucine-rich repeat (LRR) protein